MTDVECKLLLSFKDRYKINTLSDLDSFLLKLADAEMNEIAQLIQYQEYFKNSDDPNEFEYRAGSAQDEMAYNGLLLLKEVMNEEE